MTPRLRVAELLFIVSICVAQGLGAQPTTIKFKHLTPDHGLPDGEVVAILQDRRGHMGFGTWGRGLDRYDGYQFVTCSYEPEESICRSHDASWELYEDQDGIVRISNLWSGSLNYFDREASFFFTFIHVPKHSNCISAASRSDAADADSCALP